MLYHRRSALEHINARIERDFKMERHYVRAKSSMQLHITLHMTVKLAATNQAYRPRQAAPEALFASRAGNLTRNNLAMMSMPTGPRMGRIREMPVPFALAALSYRKYTKIHLMVKNEPVLIDSIRDPVSKGGVSEISRNQARINLKIIFSKMLLFASQRHLFEIIRPNYGLFTI